MGILCIPCRAAHDNEWHCFAIYVSWVILSSDLLKSVTFVNLFVPAFSLIVLVRVIMSYFAGPDNRLYEMLVNITEPVLAPVRKRLPQSPGIDFAPLVTLLVLQVLQTLLSGLVTT